MKFLNFVISWFFGERLEQPCPKIFLTDWTLGRVLRDTFPAVLAQPVRTTAWHVTQQRTISILSTEGFVTNGAMSGSPSQQLLVPIKVLRDPLSVNCRHCFNLIRHLCPFYARRVTLRPLERNALAASRKDGFSQSKYLLQKPADSLSFQFSLALCLERYAFLLSGSLFFV